MHLTNDIDINRIIPCLCVLFYAGLCGIILKRIYGWRNLRTIHWFPPGRVFQPGQQYEWKREPHTLGLTKTKKRTNSLLTQFSQTYFSLVSKQIHRVMSYFLSCPRLSWSINKTSFYTKPSQVMDEGILREGRGGKEMWRAYNMGSRILFSSKPEYKHGRTGCIKSSFLPNSIPCSLAYIQCCSISLPTPQSALILTSGEPTVNFDPVWQM